MIRFSVLGPLMLPLLWTLSACADAPATPSTPTPSAPIVSCPKSTMPVESLHQVYPAPAATSDDTAAKVTFVLAGDQLHVAFDVHAPQLNAKKTFVANEFPYMFDAVEVFVSVTDPKGPHFPYYEFELSPYNQTFDVKIPGGGKPMVNGIHVGTDHAAQLLSATNPVHWRGEITIPLKTLGWQGDPASLVGNAFAVLGAPGARTYWSLSLPVQPKPNFHLPQFFKPFFTASTKTAACPAN